jgi:hypothetical protein
MPPPAASDDRTFTNPAISLNVGGSGQCLGHRKHRRGGGTGKWHPGSREAHRRYDKLPPNLANADE